MLNQRGWLIASLFIVIVVPLIAFEIWLLPYDKAAFTTGRLLFLRLFLFMVVGALFVLGWLLNIILRAKPDLMWFREYSVRLLIATLFILGALYLVVDGDRVYRNRPTLTRINIECYYWASLKMNLESEHANENFDIEVYELLIFTDLEEHVPFHVFNLDTTHGISTFTYRFQSLNSFREDAGSGGVMQISQNIDRRPACVPLSKQDTVLLDIPYLVQASFDTNGELWAYALDIVPGYDPAKSYEDQDAAVIETIMALTTYDEETE